jgi:hypothetical protein
MKIDPNTGVQQQAVYILCEAGAVVLHDDTRIPAAELSSDAGRFIEFCRTLDPNKNFIVALVPVETDRSIFYDARDAAQELKLHMQAPMDRASALQSMWTNYKRVKKLPSVEEGEVE